MPFYCGEFMPWSLPTRWYDPEAKRRELKRLNKRKTQRRLRIDRRRK